jgi:GrpB-like predicted nucleotidyltransferase (UPF0157 family)
MSSSQFKDAIKVEVVPHDPAWREDFEAESQQIASAMGENIITIHHIGSTAIPGIYAKPIIDFLIEVKDIAKTDEQSAVMEAIGYEAMGEFGLPGRRYFRKNRSPGIRTHNIHTYEVGSPEITRHLAFRDYMIAHPEAAQQYSELKRELAKKYPQDIEGYMDGKDGFVKTMEKKALEWQTMMQTHQDLLAKAYAAFNVRDIDAVLAVMHPDVEWANGMEGGHVHGHEAVRDYWTRQWSLMNPHVEPERFQQDETGRMVVDVHQVVRDLDGNVIVDQMVQHVYIIENDLIRRMDIQES